MYDLFSKERNSEPLEHLGEITAVAVRNDGEQLVSATMKGEVLLERNLFMRCVFGT
jgi:hypothetical protein